MAKPDFIEMVTGLYRRRRRYQGRRRLPRHPPEPQGHFLGMCLIIHYDSTQLTGPPIYYIYIVDKHF